MRIAVNRRSLFGSLVASVATMFFARRAAAGGQTANSVTGNKACQREPFVYRKRIDQPMDITITLYGGVNMQIDCTPIELPDGLSVDRNDGHIQNLATSVSNS